MLGDVGRGILCFLLGVVALVVLVCMMVADSHGQALPNEPEAAGHSCFQGTIDEQGQFTYKEITCSRVSNWRVLPPYTPKRGFFSGHPTRTVLIFGAVGGAIGLTVALLTNHTCPKKINGYPYDGNGKCPGKDYDPSAKSIGLRWRF